MKLLLVLALGVAAVAALPQNSRSLVGGSITNIVTHPFAVALLSGSGETFRRTCSGAIINSRSVLSAANCFDTNSNPSNWRSRVGSTNGSTGGVVHNTQRILKHPSYNRATYDNDVSVLRITNTFAFNNNVRAASIANANFNVPDNAAVWAIGWGRTFLGVLGSDRLQQAQVRVVNQAVCKSRYAELGRNITDKMLCAGWLGVLGYYQCLGNSGGPLIYNNVIVGVYSFGEPCALPRFPGVNARVSRFYNWIQDNA